MNNVSSSNLSQVGYNNNILTIKFHNGDLYQYYDVPLSVYSGLMSASSHGEYFCKYIRDEYRCSKIN